MTAHDDDASPHMHRRRTTMFDGRTMYYYSFGAETHGSETHGSQAQSSKSHGSGLGDAAKASQREDGDQSGTSSETMEERDV